MQTPAANSPGAETTSFTQKSAWSRPGPSGTITEPSGRGGGRHTADRGRGHRRPGPPSPSPPGLATALPELLGATQLPVPGGEEVTFALPDPPKASPEDERMPLRCGLFLASPPPRGKGWQLPPTPGAKWECWKPSVCVWWGWSTPNLPFPSSPHHFQHCCISSIGFRSSFFIYFGTSAPKERFCTVLWWVGSATPNFQAGVDPPSPATTPPPSVCPPLPPRRSALDAGGLLPGAVARRQRPAVRRPITATGEVLRAALRLRPHAGAPLCGCVRRWWAPIGISVAGNL